MPPGSRGCTLPSQDPQEESSVHQWAEMIGSQGCSRDTRSEVWKHFFFSFLTLRTENMTLKKPKTFHKNQRRVFRAPDLKGMLDMFRGEESWINNRVVEFMWCQGAKWGRGCSFQIRIEGIGEDGYCLLLMGLYLMGNG